MNGASFLPTVTDACESFQHGGGLGYDGRCTACGYPQVLHEAIEALRAEVLLSKARESCEMACREFVRKCETGEARSRRRYAEMKAAVTAVDTARRDIHDEVGR